MHVEITKMVYQHPWYVFSALHTSNGRLGGLFISLMEKVAVGDETQLSATDRTRLIVPTIERARRDQTHYRVRSSSTGHVRSHLHRSRTTRT